MARHHFSVGMRVKCRQSVAHIQQGWIGTIRSITTGTPPLGVEWDTADRRSHNGRAQFTCPDDHGWYVYPRHIEPLTGDDARNTELRVGTRVRATRTSGPVREGWFGTIRAMGDGTPPIGVEWDQEDPGLHNGNRHFTCPANHGWYMHREEIEAAGNDRSRVPAAAPAPANPAAAAGFRTGQRVKATTSSGPIRQGWLGTVRAVTTGTPPIGVEWDQADPGLHNGRRHFTCPDNHGWYMKVNEIEVVAAHAAFRVGQRIKATTSSGPVRRGWLGTVKAISTGSPPIGVQWDHTDPSLHGGNRHFTTTVPNTGWYMHPGQIEDAPGAPPAPAAPPPAISVAPPSTTHSSGHKIGDRIRATVATGPIRIGWVGTVKAISTGSPPIGVQWDQSDPALHSGNRHFTTSVPNTGWYMHPGQIEAVVAAPPAAPVVQVPAPAPLSVGSRVRVQRRVAHVEEGWTGTIRCILGVNPPYGVQLDTYHQSSHIGAPGFSCVAGHGWYFMPGDLVPDDSPEPPAPTPQEVPVVNSVPLAPSPIGVGYAAYSEYGYPTAPSAPTAYPTAPIMGDPSLDNVYGNEVDEAFDFF